MDAQKTAPETAATPLPVAAPLKVDFFGYYVDRSAVQTHVAAAVTAAQDGVAAEPGLLGKVDDLLLGTTKLPSFIKKVAGRFGQALSVTAPDLLVDDITDVLPQDTVLRRQSAFQPGLPQSLLAVKYFFDRDRLFPAGNEVSLIELRYLRLLPRLANLDWGFDGSGLAALQTRLQQLRIYFVEFFHGRFKDRNGTSVSPDGGKFDPFHISPQLAGQLVRVLIEFTGDVAFRVPAIVPDGADPDTSFTCAKAGVITTAIKNVKLDGTGTDYSELVGSILVYAAKHAEAAVRTQLGALIRGGGMAGINNEVVAEAITAALGTLAKKVAEKVAYEALVRFITTPSSNPALKAQILAVLDYLHRNGPKPPSFPPT